MAFAQSQKRSFLFTILGVLLFYEVYLVASFSAPLPQSFDIVCANAEIVRTVLLNLTLDYYIQLATRLHSILGFGSAVLQTCLRFEVWIYSVKGE